MRAARPFGADRAILTAAYVWTNVARRLLFWLGLIFTRPLSATAGDFFNKPMSDGWLAVRRPLASAVIAVFIVVCIVVFLQRAG
jgi:uncharacterized membrane-anchored protein